MFLVMFLWRKQFLDERVKSSICLLFLSIIVVFVILIFYVVNKAYAVARRQIDPNMVVEPPPPPPYDTLSVRAHEEYNV